MKSSSFIPGNVALSGLTDAFFNENDDVGPQNPKVVLASRGGMVTGPESGAKVGAGCLVGAV